MASTGIGGPNALNAEGIYFQASFIQRNLRAAR